MIPCFIAVGLAFAAYRASQRRDALTCLLLIVLWPLKVAVWVLELCGEILEGREG